jgi:NAD(P)-dependent dehydrogenase (short-subunit alcohol dehydrogenase family)
MIEPTYRSDMLAGRTAIVTGGTGGIGAGVGNALAKVGADVAGAVLAVDGGYMVA